MNNNTDLHNPEWHWREFGLVANPNSKNGRLSRIGGRSAYEAITALLELQPNNPVHKEKLIYMAQRDTKWGNDMKKLLLYHWPTTDREE